MKKIIILITIILYAVCINAQSVSYSYNILSEEGCTVNFTPTYIDNNAYLIVSIKSENLFFSEQPTILLKFSDETTLQLNGEKIATQSSSSSILVGQVMVPVSEIKTTAKFPLSEDEIILFQKGVIKIRISTLPYTHERVFKKDKIGFEIASLFKNAKYKNKDF